VHVQLANRVLRYEVTETFVNRAGGLGEADYIFPLPSGAAFEDLKLSINGELVSGETMNAADARRVYEEIVRKHRDPALVEWMGSGLLRARIFPIQPGEEKRVVVRFQTVAAREGSALRVDYVRGTAPAGQAIPRPMPILREDSGREPRVVEATSSFSLTFPMTDGFGSPYSPTHSLRVSDHRGERTVTATGDAREVTILLPLRRIDAASLTVLTHRQPDEDGFVLITITPPTAPRRSTPRDLTFVVDVSGSMRGQKLEQAKAAGRALLETLGSGDRFRIIDFSTDVRSFRDEFVPATSDNLRAGRRYLEDLTAEGSTNISGALETALDDRSPDGRLPLVVFVTDGEPTVGERNADAIAALAARRRGDARIFAFGISADVNSALIEQLAVEGHGTPHFVRSGESVERSVSLLASRLTSPVLTNVRIYADGIRLRQMHPVLPLDLFAGQDLVVLARYDGSGTARLRVEGRSATGTVTWTSDAAFLARENGNRFVPRLWAAQRLGWLAAEKRKNGGTTELDAEIKSLGERYGIPTEFSSYLVLEPGMQMADRRLDARSRVNASPAATPAMRLGEVVVTGAAADLSSKAVSQEARFEQARQAAAQRETKSLAALDSASRAAQGSAIRQIGARQFSQQQGAWVDQRYTQSQRLLKVKAFSPLYFELVSKLSGLSEVLVLGEQVIVSGRAVAIQVGPDGAERMSEREMAELVKAWQ
jgi:Ca-activated chloride channel family protein